MDVIWKECLLCDGSNIMVERGENGESDLRMPRFQVRIVWGMMIVVHGKEMIDCWEGAVFEDCHLGLKVFNACG